MQDFESLELDCISGFGCGPHDLPLDKIPGTVALLGVAGSRAFGLATAESDVDYRGCYVAPTRDLFRLRTPDESFVYTKPDVSMHEVGRLLRLAVAANPTALETLFYSNYIMKSPVGTVLLENRNMFITEKIRNTHLGFANSQFEKLKKRYAPQDPRNSRFAKHARHTMRVIQLTETVLTTGVYDLTVKNPEEIFAFGELGVYDMVRKIEYEIERIKRLPKTLPPAVDEAVVDDLLILIREGYYDG